MAVGAIVADAGCLELRAEDESAASANACTSCHGSAERAGSTERQAAPPIDVDGNTDPLSPGVGAHEVHLNGSATHAPVPCTECHAIPAATDSPGHTDSAAPAEFVPGRVARLGEREPAYDGEALSCSRVYCHQNERPVWVAPRTSEQACGTCHTLPPKLPHEQVGVDDCERCHGDVVAAGQIIINPARHVNGGLDVVGECYDCHGTPESLAPPPDTHGAVDATYVGVGAHQVHLDGTVNSRPVACTTCHVVPATVGDVGHIDGGRAEVVLSGAALAYDRAAEWDPESQRCAGGWCHAPGAAAAPSPDWTVASRGPLPCDSCHGMPPAPPHTQVATCPNCHGSTSSGLPPDVVISDRNLHVNGVIDY